MSKKNPFSALTGKNVEDARGKCQAQNPLCSVTQVK